MANGHSTRAALGPQQRDLDLGLMGGMRRGACLSVVIGAGASMDAGGPSWAELVRRLLVLATQRGHEISQMREEPGGTPEERTFKRVVVDVKHLAPAGERRAREILAAIETGSADTEQLMDGAQLCLDLMGQHLFTDLTGVLYEGGRQPGPIHRAIAELATPQHVPDRRGWFPAGAGGVTTTAGGGAGAGGGTAGPTATYWPLRSVTISAERIITTAPG